MSNLAHRTETGAYSVSKLARLTADARPEPVARIRRPRVAKQPFSRTPAQAAREDGVDTSVTVTHVLWTEVALSDCEFGCKVYARSDRPTVTRVVHHSVYGCPK